MRRKRNPLDLLPSTGNDALDALARRGVETAARRVYDGLDPGVQQIVSTALEVFTGDDAPLPVAASQPGGTGAGGDVGRFLGELMALRGGLIAVLGRRGSGKTALCLKLAQEYRRPVYVVGIPQSVLGPLGFREIAPEQIATLPNGCVLVIDDVALFFSNRDYERGKALHQLIIESRHRGVLIIVNAHGSALIDKYLLEATVLFLKPSSGMTDDLQRSGLRRVVERADAAFAALPRASRNGYAYAVSDELDFQGMIAYRPPQGWSERVSTHHAEGHQ